MPALEDMLGAPPPAEEQVETPVQPEAAEQTPPAVEPQQPSFAESGLYTRAKSAGLPLDGIDSSDRLAETILDRWLQDRAYADHGRASLSSKPANAQAQAEEADAEREDNGEFDFDGHFTSLWNAPQIDQQAQFLIQSGIVMLGEDGLYAAKPGYEAMALPVLNSLNQAHVAQRDQLQKFFNGNPYKAVYEGLLPALRHELSKDFSRLNQENVKTYEQQAYEEKFIDTNKTWLYNSGDASKGLSQDGEKFRQTVVELRQQGITNPQTLANYALKLSGVNTQPAAGTPPAAGAAPPASGRQRDGQGQFVKAKEGLPAEPPKTKQESFIDQARRRASASSNSGSHSAEEFKVQSDGELDEIWTSGWKKHVAAA